MQELADGKMFDTKIVQAQHLLTRMLVMMRLVSPEKNDPIPETWELVAAVCGLSDAKQLLAEHDAARQSIATLMARHQGRLE